MLVQLSANLIQVRNLRETGIEYYTAGKITGEILHAHGVNFDLAPVLDVNSNPRNPVIGVRSYGDDPTLVGRYGLQMVRGLTAGGVLSAAKHFPGHGDTSVDSHLTLPTVHKSKAELEQMEIAPFAHVIKTGLLPAVTISHILFPAIDEQFPATISKKIVTGLLKEELGFNGLVISDCMEMKAMQTYFGTAESAAAAINAGRPVAVIEEYRQTLPLYFIHADEYAQNPGLQLLKQCIETVWQMPDNGYAGPSESETETE